VHPGLRDLFFPRGGSARFPALDGLRAIAAIWIIGLHTVSMAGSFWVDATRDVNVFSKEDFTVVANSPLLRVLVKGDMGVDLFFVLSGFLIATILFKEHGRTGTVDIGRFYRNRFLRLAPAYLVAMGLFAVWGRGSTASVWSNILYVNNFVPTYQQFMLHAWSLAVEEQFYLIFPLALLAACWAAPRPGSAGPSGWIWTALIALGLVVRAAVVVQSQVWLHLAANPVIDRDACAFFNDVLYDKFYTRYGALLCGVAAARVYANGASEHFFRGRARPIVCLAATVAVFAIVCSPPPVAPRGAAPGPVEVSVFLTLYQTAFAAGIAFLVLALVTRWAVLRPLGWMLSWRGWAPLAQLSYGAYLLHPLIIQRVYLAFPPRTPAPTVMLAYYAGFVVMAFAAAMPLRLLVEVPGLRLRQAVAHRVELAPEATP
jgi:peptidoglycan/LPS O-acetylase OafA/YrhL